MGIHQKDEPSPPDHGKRGGRDPRERVTGERVPEPDRDSVRAVPNDVTNRDDGFRVNYLGIQTADSGGLTAWIKKTDIEMTLFLSKRKRRRRAGLAVGFVIYLGLVLLVIRFVLMR